MDNTLTTHEQDAIWCKLRQFEDDNPRFKTDSSDQALATATRLVEYGFEPIPVSLLLKRPTELQWPTGDFPLEMFGESPIHPELGWKVPHINVGVRFTNWFRGEEGKALMCLDFDTERARLRIDKLFSKLGITTTGFSVGRQSKPGSNHILVVKNLHPALCNTELRTKKILYPFLGPKKLALFPDGKNRDEYGKEIKADLELLGQRQQTLAYALWCRSRDFKSMLKADRLTIEYKRIERLEPNIVEFDHLDLWATIVEWGAEFGSFPKGKEFLPASRGQSTQHMGALASQGAIHMPESIDHNKLLKSLNVMLGIPEAYSEHGGHDATLNAAMMCVHDLKLTNEESLYVMQNVFNKHKTLADPDVQKEWSEVELAHKILDARHQTSNKKSQKTYSSPSYSVVSDIIPNTTTLYIGVGVKPARNRSTINVSSSRAAAWYYKKSIYWDNTDPLKTTFSPEPRKTGHRCISPEITKLDFSQFDKVVLSMTSNCATNTSTIDDMWEITKYYRALGIANIAWRMPKYWKEKIHLLDEDNSHEIPAPANYGQFCDIEKQTKKRNAEKNSLFQEREKPRLDLALRWVEDNAVTSIGKREEMLIQELGQFSARTARKAIKILAANKQEVTQISECVVNSEDRKPIQDNNTITVTSTCTRPVAEKFSPNTAAGLLWRVRILQSAHLRKNTPDRHVRSSNRPRTHLRAKTRYSSFNANCGHCDFGQLVSSQNARPPPCCEC